MSIFERVGGEPFFRELVERFYAAVEQDPVLRPLYPDELTEPKEHLALFLIQYWGGPATYNEQRGHPRLRMRHAPFAVGPRERDAWFTHMRDAVESFGLPGLEQEQLLGYFDAAATAMINTG